MTYQAEPVAFGLEVVLLKPWITEIFHFGWRISSHNIVTKFPCWFSSRFLNMGLYCLAIMPYSRISSSSPSFKTLRSRLCNLLVIYEHTWVHYSIISKWLFFLLIPLLFKYRIYFQSSACFTSWRFYKMTLCLRKQLCLGIGWLVLLHCCLVCGFSLLYVDTRVSQKLSTLLFFQFIYTNVGLNKYVIFLHSLLPFQCTWSSGPQDCVFPPRFSIRRATIYAPLPALLCP